MNTSRKGARDPHAVPCKAAQLTTIGTWVRKARSPPPSQAQGCAPRRPRPGETPLKTQKRGVFSRGGLPGPRNRLIEDHLMEDYAAKRHVVRAALAQLQRLGVVVKPPHLGAHIRRFDAQS